MIRQSRWELLDAACARFARLTVQTVRRTARDGEYYVATNPLEGKIVTVMALKLSKISMYRLWP